jgi:hypothetical protein
MTIIELSSLFDINKQLNILRKMILTKGNKMLKLEDIKNLVSGIQIISATVDILIRNGDTEIGCSGDCPNCDTHIC